MESWIMQSVYTHSRTKTGIIPCSLCTTEHQQGLLQGQRSFSSRLPGKNVMKIHGIGSGFLQREDLTHTIQMAHRSDNSSTATLGVSLEEYSSSSPFPAEQIEEQTACAGGFAPKSI